MRILSDAEELSNHIFRDDDSVVNLPKSYSEKIINHHAYQRDLVKYGNEYELKCEILFIFWDKKRNKYKRNLLLL